MDDDPLSHNDEVLAHLCFRNAVRIYTYYMIHLRGLSERFLRLVYNNSRETFLGRRAAGTAGNYSRVAES